MATFRAFKGIRPKKQWAKEVASLPYDVMNREEAKKMAEGNPKSFLHIVRSEIDMADSVDAHHDSVYDKAKENLEKFLKEGIMFQDEKPYLYIYRQIFNGRVQTGIVGCASIDEYLNDIVKRHEFTQPEKELDRINNIDRTDANTEPLLLTYRKDDSLNKIMNNWIKFHMPEYNFTSEDAITHIVWVIDDDSAINEITEIFKNIEYLYIADGHHRTASSAKVTMKRRKENPDYDGTEEFNYFLSVLFSDEDLCIMDYNRVVKDLNGLTKDELFIQVKNKFEIEKWEGKEAFKPMKEKTFGMYVDGAWYKLSAKPGTWNDEDPLERLDVAILQNNLLNPVLGIDNPSTNKRVEFIGGIRGLKELEHRVATDMKVAFSMYPTSMQDTLRVADAGLIMPTKSTWFEPKLRSGLFVHKLK
jgi:uncharacterized protein (DUF1015 family)